jgi:hypothetical protein
MIFNQLEQLPVKDIIKILSFARQGLTHFDITRIIFSLNEEDDYEDVNYLQWSNFLTEHNFRNQKKNDKVCKESHQYKKALQWDYNLVQVEYYESIGGDKFILKQEMRKFINNKAINDMTVSDICIKQYLKYMCVLSR